MPPDAAPPPPAAPPLLLLVGEANLSPGDRAMSERLTRMGFQVQVKVVDSQPDAVDAAAMARMAKLVVLSSSLRGGGGGGGGDDDAGGPGGGGGGPGGGGRGGAALARMLREVPVPLLSCRYQLSANLGLAEQGNFAVANSEQLVQIRMPQHPLAAGRQGYVTVVSERSAFGIVVPVAAAAIVGTIAEETNEALVFGLEKGAADRQGPAPARRAGFFAQENTFMALNDAGWALFEATVRWTVGAP
jgi:hypothetical protein